MGKRSLGLVALGTACALSTVPPGTASAGDDTRSRSIQQAGYQGQSVDNGVRPPVRRVRAAAPHPPQLTYSMLGEGDAVVSVNPRSGTARTLVAAPRRGPALVVDAWSTALSRVFYSRFTVPPGKQVAPDLAVDSLPQTGGRPSRELTGGGNADVSRDGKRIVYARAEGGTFNLFVADRGDRKSRRLTAAGGLSPRFSADGRRVVFTRSYPVRAAEGEEQADLFTIGVDGTGLTRVTGRADVSDDTASFSPDGKRLLFARFTAAPDFPSDVPPAGVWSVGIYGHGLRLVRRGAHNPDWATNGWVTHTASYSPPDGLGEQVIVRSPQATRPRDRPRPGAQHRDGLAFCPLNGRLL